MATNFPNTSVEIARNVHFCQNWEQGAIAPHSHPPWTIARSKFEIILHTYIFIYRAHLLIPVNSGILFHAHTKDKTASQAAFKKRKFCHYILGVTSKVS